jgi:hypothetical protein
MKADEGGRPDELNREPREPRGMLFETILDTLADLADKPAAFF